MNVLETLRGGLIVSVQAEPESPLADPAVIVAMALASLGGGAVGVRIQSVPHIAAVRARTDVPIVGLIKHAEVGFEPYITPRLADVRAILAAGADIVAFDATDRARPDGSTIRSVVETIHASGALAMADCSSVEDADRAHADGADILGTTLCGYTAATRGRSLPALDVVAAIHGAQRFCIAEGGIATPTQAAAAFEAGADAIVVGTAITNVDALARSFARACKT